MADRPGLAGGHALVVHRVRHHPLRGALEDREVFDVRRDRRRDLEAACAGAEQGEAHAAVVEALGPARRVERRPGEVVDAVDVGQLRDVQRADARDHETGFERLAVAGGVTDVDAPARVRFVPGCARDLGLEAAVRPQAVLVEHAREVGAQLRVLTVVLAPVVGWLERITVLVARDVDARARVAVLVPGASGPGVLLDDREGQAGLLQADARLDARHPRADHDDRRVGLHRGVDLVAPT